MRSPWNGGSISLRWRRCAGPSSTRIELGPTNGSRNVELAPGDRDVDRRGEDGAHRRGIRDDDHRRVRPRGAQRERLAVAGGAAAQQGRGPRQPLPGLDGAGSRRAGRQHRPDVTTCAGSARAGGRGRRARAAPPSWRARRASSSALHRARAEGVGDGQAAVDGQRGLDARRRPRRSGPSCVGGMAGEHFAGSSVAVELRRDDQERERRRGWRAGSRPRPRRTSQRRRASRPWRCGAPWRRESGHGTGCWRGRLREAGASVPPS